MGGTVRLRASLCYLVPEFCLLGKRPVASGPVLTSVGWVRPRPHLLPTQLLDTSLALWLLSPSLSQYLPLLFPTLHFFPSLKDPGFTKGSLGQMAEDTATTTLATTEEPAGAPSGQRLSHFAVRGLEDAVERGPALALHSTLPLLSPRQCYPPEGYEATVRGHLWHRRHNCNCSSQLCVQEE